MPRVRSNSELAEREEANARERARAAGFNPGRLLGNGCARLVFVDGSDLSQIIKVPRSGNESDNPTEFRAWTAAKTRADLRRWMVPCVLLKDDILVQKRSRPLTHTRRFSLTLPYFFGDIEGFNISRYAGEVRIHDYASVKWLYLDSSEAMKYVFSRAGDGKLNREYAYPVCA